MLFQDLACAALCFSQKVRLPDLVELWVGNGLFMASCQDVDAALCMSCVTCAQCCQRIQGKLIADASQWPGSSSKADEQAPVCQASVSL